MSERTVLHSPAREEEARKGWYLRNRDSFVARLVRREANWLRRPSPPQVLDAGCGIGGLTALLAAEGLDVTGIDADELSLQWGAESGRLKKYVQADLQHLPFEDRAFDLCVSSEVLEHLDDDVAGLRELARVCRGTLVLTVPAHRHLWTESDDVLLHRRRYSRQEVTALLRKAGLAPVAIKGYGIVPGLAILGYRLLTRSKTDSGTVPTETSKGSATPKPEPLASRFQPPRWVDALLSLFFRLDLRLSEWGLIPWGQGWWIVARAGDRSQLRHTRATLGSVQIETGTEVSDK